MLGFLPEPHHIRYSNLTGLISDGRTWALRTEPKHAYEATLTSKSQQKGKQA